MTTGSENWRTSLHIVEQDPVEREKYLCIIIILLDKEAQYFGC